MTLSRPAGALLAMALAAACSDGRPTPVAPAPAAGSIQVVDFYQLRVGDSLDLWSQVYDQSGAPMQNAVVTWTSDHPEVVSVDPKAKVRAAGVGCATATATSGAARASTLICSASPQVREVYVLPRSDRVTLAVGTGMSIRPQARPSGFDSPPPIEGPILWSTADPAVATIDADGTLHGVAGGTTTVATVVDGFRVVTKVVVTRGYAMTVLESPAGEYSRPVRFNATGMVVGTRGACPPGDCPSVFPAVWQSGVLLQTNLPPSALPADVNDAGQVVGTYLAGKVKHAFLWKDGVFTDLSPRDTMDVAATAINAAGRVVGYRKTGVETGPYTETGTIVRWDGGVETDQGTFGYVLARAWDVSEDGTIAATLCTRGTTCVGALVRGDSAQVLSPLPTPPFRGIVMSRKGVVAASLDYEISTPEVFLSRDGAVSLVKGLHHDSIDPEDVSSSGSVVGSWWMYFHDNWPFVWSGGDPLLLDGLTPHPEWTPLEANAIDDAGRIAAVVRLPDGTAAAVLLTPR